MSRPTRVLLIYPRPSVSSPQKSPPLSILHVGEALKQAKMRGKSDETYEVMYYDERYDEWPDLDWPDVVGVSSMTGVQIRGAIRLLKAAKAKGKRTILGGIHVTMRPPEESLREDFVDAVVLSEGEWAVIEAVHGGPKQVVHSHLSGTADHVSPVSPETLIHFQRSARTGDTVLMTSRGCPFRCGFSVSEYSQIPLEFGGYKMASEVRILDRVLGWDEKAKCIQPTVVTELCHLFPGQEFLITTENDDFLCCSSEHPILTKGGWRLAKYLTTSDFVMTHTQPGGWTKVRYIEGGEGTNVHVNLQCHPHPSFVAENIVTHNCYIQQFFERNERGSLAWQSVDLDRWRHDVLFLKTMAGVNKYEHGDDHIGRWDRAREIIAFLRDNGIRYRPSLRAHQITDDVAREMAEMGVKHISVGMETASKRMLKLTEKDITPDDQIRCAEALAKHGIHPLFYYILKMPTETPAETNESLDQMDRFAKIFKSYGTPLTMNAYCFVPLPGSPLFDLVDKEMLPKTMAEWANFSLNQTNDDFANAAYWVIGLHFHKAKGDKTDRNFPGLMRLLIAPFELLASLRWKLRWFAHYKFEKWAVETLLKWASLRYENAIHKGKFKNLREMEAMDFGVVEKRPDVGSRGEFLTGEIDTRKVAEGDGN